MQGGCDRSQLRELSECMRPAGKPEENAGINYLTQQQEAESPIEEFQPLVNPQPLPR